MVRPPTPRAQPARPVLLALPLLNEPLAACWETSQSSAPVMLVATAGAAFWSWSMSTVSPVVSMLPPVGTSSVQPCSVSALGEKASRKKPAAHCWSRSNASAEAASGEPASWSVATA